MSVAVHKHCLFIQFCLFLLDVLMLKTDNFCTFFTVLTENNELCVQCFRDILINNLYDMINCVGCFIYL